MALMDKRELAAYLGIPVGQMTKLITKRQCPTVTWVGNQIRFDPADVEAWVAAQKEKPATVKPATPPVLGLVPQLGHPPAGPRPTPPPPPRPARQGKRGVAA